MNAPPLFEHGSLPDDPELPGGWPVWMWDSWPGDTLVIIPCSKGKIEHHYGDEPVQAVNLYTGPIFKLALRAARALVPDEQIRILSARHGFVPLDRAMFPYNTTWSDPGCIHLYRLREQAATEWDPRPETIVGLCSNTYAFRLQQIWDDVVLPLAGSRGIGEQKQRLNRIAQLRDETR